MSYAKVLAMQDGRTDGRRHRQRPTGEPDEHIDPYITHMDQHEVF